MDWRSLIDTPPEEWPDGVGSTLLAVLVDRQAKESDRIRAAELSGELVVINDELVDALLDILASSQNSERLRVACADALADVVDYADVEGFEEPEEALISEEKFDVIRETLRRLFVDPKVPEVVRMQVLRTSVHSPRDWHPAAIRTAFQSRDEAWRETAMFAAQFVRGFDDEILRGLGSRNVAFQRDAVCAAGNWQLEKAWPHLLAFIASPKTDKDVLLASIDAIASIRPEEAEEALANLSKSKDEDIVLAVEEALAMAEVSLEEDEDEEDEEEGGGEDDEGDDEDDAEDEDEGDEEEEEEDAEDEDDEEEEGDR